VKTVSTKLDMSNPFIYYGVHWRYLPVHSVYRLCPRAIHEWGILARSIFPQLTPFLKLSKARAFWSIRPTEGGDLSHRLAARRKSYPRTTCYARHIRCKSTFPKARLLGVEVPNELPLKSNSLRSLRQQLARVTRASAASECIYR